jgi:hypothetical protein
MSERAYLSNISRLWSINKQEALLRVAFPGWPNGVTVFRDDLQERDRRGRHPVALEARSAMLRSSTRRVEAERITVASLAVLAWTAEDMMECLTLALARGAAVRVLDADLLIAPSEDAAVLHRAAVAFREAREKQIAVERGHAGGRISADKKAAEARAKVETIRARWALPSADYPTSVLLAEAGISRNTAIHYLEKRSVVQALHQSALKRKATNDRKKAAQAAKEQAQ